MSTQFVTLWNVLVQNGRCMTAFIVLLAGLIWNPVARADHQHFHHGSGRHAIDRDDFCLHHRIPEHHHIPQPACNPHSSAVPEIDAGAAIGGLALLVGTVMLLRDRAAAR